MQLEEFPALTLEEGMALLREKYEFVRVYNMYPKARALASPPTFCVCFLFVMVTN